MRKNSPWKYARALGHLLPQYVTSACPSGRRAQRGNFKRLSYFYLLIESTFQTEKRYRLYCKEPMFMHFKIWAICMCASHEHIQVQHVYQPVLMKLTKRHTLFLADIHRSNLEGDMFMVKWRRFLSYVNTQFFLFFNNDTLPYKITYLDCSFSSFLLLCKKPPYSPCSKASSGNVSIFPSFYSLPTLISSLSLSPSSLCLKNI